MSKQIQGMENVKRCPVAELNCLAFLNLKHTEKKNKVPQPTPPPAPPAKPITPDNLLLQYCAGCEV